jgi:cholera toxin transcriptional activator
MTDGLVSRRYRFGVFEADAAAGELWQRDMRVRIHAQPFSLLVLLIERQGQVVTREEIAQVLWPDGTFVDFEQGVNSAVGRLREALGDKASSPRFVETLARKGYRFVAPVEVVGVAADDAEVEEQVLRVAQDDKGSGDAGEGFAVLATAEDLPQGQHRSARTLFLLLQFLYLGFYVGALANLAEVQQLLAMTPWPEQIFLVLVASAAALISLRAFLICAVLFRAPKFRERYLKLWGVVLVADVLWSVSPFLLLHHINFGLALACVPLLVYSPFAQRSLVLMGAADVSANA